MTFHVQFSTPRLNFSEVIKLFSSVITIKKPLVPDTKLKAEKSGKKDKNSADRELEIIDSVQPSFPEYKLRRVPFTDIFNKPDSVCLDSFEQLPLVGQIDTCNRLRTYDAIYIDLQ